LYLWIGCFTLGGVTAHAVPATITIRPVTIRPAFADDRSALVRLAALDSSPVPPAPVLLAEVDGQPRAALSLADRSLVADPFFPTVDIVSLLRTHAAAVSDERTPRRGRRTARRLRPRLAAG
jgi:hypothetical protein